MITAIFFSDAQLKMIKRAAKTLVGDSRRILLERIASRLEPRGYLVDADVEAAVHAVLPELQSLKKAARDAALEEIARNPKWHAARVIRRCLCDCRRKLKDSGGEAR